MNRITTILALLALSVSVVSTGCQDSADTESTKKILGKWRVSDIKSSVIDSIPPERREELMTLLRQTTMEFTSDGWVRTTGGGKYRAGKWRIDHGRLVTSDSGSTVEEREILAELTDTKLVIKTKIRDQSATMTLEHIK